MIPFSEPRRMAGSALPVAQEGQSLGPSRGRWQGRFGNGELRGSGRRGVGRREFIRSAAMLSGLTAVEAGASSFLRPSGPGRSFIDVNVNLWAWPVRHSSFAEPDALAGMLRRKGVTQAWVGSLDGLLHKDLGAVNSRLAMACRRFGQGRLLPFGSVNPVWPDWEEELRRCAEEHGMRGIRLHPNYHGYGLEQTRFGRLLEMAVERGLVIQLALGMEDERMMHPLLRVSPVDAAPLADALKRAPGVQLVLLNAARLVRGDALRRLLDAGDVYVEIATLDGVGCVERLLTHVPLDRILFGSNAPLFYFDSALLKLSESALAPPQLHAVRVGNAERLMLRAVDRGSRTP